MFVHIVHLISIKKQKQLKIRFKLAVFKNKKNKKIKLVYFIQTGKYL